ncbi:MAG: tRNA 2-thiouridine(34) synthase MnmA [Sphaerochaetaceae bacterium]|nr:tRNA 2-thiouridine(34) synthase MnmA [Sphaerochaetaceae bacterium]
MQKILVGMSGGIDSSVAAYLLKKQGYEVQGVTMSVWKEGHKFSGDVTKDACFSPNKKAEIEKTREICEKLGIKHTVLDISDLYESIVLKNFRDEYMNGRTPNPCIWCNQKIKFGAMVDYAREAGLEFDYFATGHYARIENLDGRYCLERGLDPFKDQSYFLYRLSQKQLSGIMFPLGSMKKTDVREIDVELGFHPQGMTESQDFYSGSYSDLLDVEPKVGNIVDCDGKVLGKHNGIWNYTIGQRKGLGVSAPKPLYVISLNVQKNEVVVGYEDKTVNTVVRASNLNWVSIDGISGTLHASAKIRSTGTPVVCDVYMDSMDRLCAHFDTPVKAATCGQSLVVYDGDKVLCGGIIEEVE